MAFPITRTTIPAAPRSSVSTCTWLMSHAVLATASASPTSTPSKRFPTTIATAVTPSTITFPAMPAPQHPHLPHRHQLAARVHQQPRQRRPRNDPEDPGTTTVKTRQPHPCSTRETLVWAPACTFAALRTITAVIGSAPSAPHTAFRHPAR